MDQSLHIMVTCSNVGVARGVTYGRSLLINLAMPFSRTLAS